MKKSSSSIKRLEFALRIKKAKAILPTDKELADFAGTNRVQLDRELKKESKV